MLGEYFAEMLLEGPRWASFFVEEPTEGLCWASFSRQPTLRRSWMQRGARGWLRWGFARHDALCLRVAGVSEPHVVQFPPFGGGEAVGWGGEVPKVQTTSAKYTENGVSWARWSAFWAQWHLARCVCSQVSPLFRAPTREIARTPADLHVHPFMRTSTPQHVRGRGCPRASHRVNVSMKGPRPPPIGLTCV